MSALPPDYDTDPGRWRSWAPPRDVHEAIAGDLAGPLLDVGCGQGRLRALLGDDVIYIGVDCSPAQLSDNPFGPLVRADMRALPFPDSSFAEVTHLWCLYHVDEPLLAIREARRVLRFGGRYYASTSSRTNDPELVPDGYPPTSFDAEEAVALVESVFNEVQPYRWEGPFVTLDTRDVVLAYCRHHHLPERLADQVTTPVALTKRGVLVTARKDEGS